MAYYGEVLSEIYRAIQEIDHLLSFSVLNENARKQLKDLSIQIRLLAARAEEEGI
jgi:hypothetical protein